MNNFRDSIRYDITHNNNQANPNITNTQRRNVGNRATTSNKKYKGNIKTKIAAGLLAVSLATGIGIGAGIHHRNNERMDDVYEAYKITEMSLTDNEARTVSGNGYNDYISVIKALDVILEKSNKKDFHDIVRQVDFEKEILDSEKITNLALEVFKVSFAEKYNTNPHEVLVKHKNPDIDKPQSDFNGEIGKYDYTAILYRNNSGEGYNRLEKEKLVPGNFTVFGFNQSGEPIVYADTLPESEYSVIAKILNAQTYENDIGEAMKALEAAKEYAERIQEQSQER